VVGVRVKAQESRWGSLQPAFILTPAAASVLFRGSLNCLRESERRMKNEEMTIRRLSGFGLLLNGQLRKYGYASDT
jgi:hypothetical protein